MASVDPIRNIPPIQPTTLRRGLVKRASDQASQQQSQQDKYELHEEADQEAPPKKKEEPSAEPLPPLDHLDIQA